MVAVDARGRIGKQAQTHEGTRLRFTFSEVGVRVYVMYWWDGRIGTSTPQIMTGVLQIQMILVAIDFVGG